MALYDVTCGHCGHKTTVSKKIAERDDLESDSCESCDTIGSYIRGLSAPIIGYSVTTPGGYGSKVSDGWKEVLKKIETAPGARKDNSSFL